MMKRTAACLLALCSLTAAAQEAGPALKVLEADGVPHFSECGTFYFLAARGSPSIRYDEFYSAGEFAFNAAILLRGRETADRMQSEIAARLMQEMSNDWQKIAVLDQKYRGKCDALLKSAGYEYAPR